MTLLGRIFAVLNFFMALVFLGFAFSVMSLIKDPRTGRSWYEVSEVYRQQVASLQKDLESLKETLARTEAECKKDIADRDSKLQEAEKQLSQERALRQEAEKQAQDVTDRFKESQVRLEQLTKDLDRRSQESAELNQRLTRALAEISERLRETELERNRRVEAEQARKVLEQRVSQLSDDVAQLQRELEKERSQSLSKTEPRGGFVAPRPPPFDVRGQILKIGQRGLVEISIGSDDGLLRNHTLEVFRLEPAPAYIGRVVIVEVEPHRAVAQFLNPEQAKQAKVGDQVASRVLARP